MKINFLPPEQHKKQRAILSPRVQKTKTGFTLIELLVVITIIGLLAALVLASLADAKKNARDARRIADLHQIKLLAELYASDNGDTPPGQDGVEYTNGAPNWIPGLSPDYIGALPSDPLDRDPYQYRYKRDKNDFETAGLMEKSANPAACGDGGSGGCNAFEVGTKLVLLNPGVGAWNAASSSVLTPLSGGGGGGTGTTTTPVSAPTDTILGWFKGVTGSGPTISGTYVHAFYFKYGTTVDPGQAFRIYLKRPGENSFTAIATFLIPVSIAPGSCTQTQRFYSNGWQLECSTYPYWRAFSPSGTSAAYPVGIYYAYVAAVDQSGMEGTASPTTQNHLLAQSLITNPVGAQSTPMPTITWSVPVWSGTNMIYYVSVYTGDGANVWTQSASVLSGATTTVTSLPYAGPALTSGTTYYTNLWGETREGPNNTYAFTMTNDAMPAFTVASP